MTRLMKLLTKTRLSVLIGLNAGCTYSQCGLVGNISVGPRRCRFSSQHTVQCFVWILSADLHVNLGSHHRSHKKEPNTPPLGTGSAASRFCDRPRCENVSRRCERLCMKIAILLNQAWMCLHVKQQQLENGIRQLTQCHGMHVIVLYFTLLCLRVWLDLLSHAPCFSTVSQQLRPGWRGRQESPLLYPTFHPLPNIPLITPPAVGC